MVAIVGHRGPDEAGFYRDERVGLGHARLSIIDLGRGQQPLHNEDKTLWVVFNGEIFNYLELRAQLEKAGHHFHTDSDTEVIVHSYEQYGEDCVNRFNGQFAFALWDVRSQELFLARDRLGIRPLFYCTSGRNFVFGSEVKSLAVHPAVRLEIDPFALAEVFTFWAPLTPRSIFKDIQEVPPGHCVRVRNGQVDVRRYWRLNFPSAAERKNESKASYAHGLRDRLIESTRLRLRADVPVGAYLSGGLDSSIITTIIKNYTSAPLITFSIRFQDSGYDEGQHQEELIRRLETRHSQLECSTADIARVFPEVVWHAEKPILRTAPVPLFLLSGLVRENNIKVVLTGEGADEFLGGYNIFKEAKIRRFWARNPDSPWRPLLLKKLYPYLAQSDRRQSYYWQNFFKDGLTETDDPCYSHLIRWHTTAKIRTLFSQRVKSAIDAYDPIGRFGAAVDGHLAEWDCLARAQYIEIETFLSGYLLSSQGDRVAMAHSVEGRFPFLDHRVVEYCSSIPPKYKLYGLTEKYLLKECMAGEIPESIRRRAKQPYRAPDSVCFLREQPDYVRELLSPQRVAEADLFDAAGVSRLIQKLERSNGRAASPRDDMSLVGILSAQLLHDQFISHLSARVARAREASAGLNVRVDEIGKPALTAAKK